MWVVSKTLECPIAEEYTQFPPTRSPCSKATVSVSPACRRTLRAARPEGPAPMIAMRGGMGGE